MFNRLTDDARRAVVLAQQEPFPLGHDAIGCEHLLLGLLREPDPLAAVTLQAHGITYTSAVSAIGRIVAPGERDWNTMPPFSPGAAAALKRTEDGFVEGEERVVGPEHLLLSVLLELEPNAVALVESFGVDAETLRSDLLKRMASPFLMRIEDVFRLKGRGIAVIGPIISGGIKTGERVEVRRGTDIATGATAIVEDKGAWNRPSEKFRLLLTEMEREDASPGDQVTRG